MEHVLFLPVSRAVLSFSCTHALLRCSVVPGGNWGRGGSRVALPGDRGALREDPASKCSGRDEICFLVVLVYGNVFFVVK